MRTGWPAGYVEGDGPRLHYTRTGGDKPPLVLAHGFSDDGLCWTPVAEALAAEYDVIMVDARGHGRSDGPEQGYSTSDYADDLARVIDTLGLGQPTVLGHSMGAATALTLAARYPERVSTILLEDPPNWWQENGPPAEIAARHAMMESHIVALKRKTHEELIAAKRAESPGWSEAELEPWAAAKLRFSFYALGGLNEARADWKETLKRITCRALLITADPELGSILSAEDAVALQGLIPQLQVVHIPGAGHNIRREQFDRYMDTVRAFLHSLS